MFFFFSSFLFNVIESWFSSFQPLSQLFPVMLMLVGHSQPWWLLPAQAVLQGPRGICCPGACLGPGVNPRALNLRGWCFTTWVISVAPTPHFFLLYLNHWLQVLWLSEDRSSREDRELFPDSICWGQGLLRSASRTPWAGGGRWKDDGQCRVTVSPCSHCSVCCPLPWDYPLPHLPSTFNPVLCL